MPTSSQAQQGYDYRGRSSGVGGKPRSALRAPNSKSSSRRPAWYSGEDQRSPPRGGRTSYPPRQRSNSRDYGIHIPTSAVGRLGDRGARSITSPSRSLKGRGSLRSSYEHAGWDDGLGGDGRRSREAYVDDPWELEEAVVDGEMVLLDRSTNRVYERGATGHEYPRLIGQIRGSGRFQRRQEARDLFAALEEATGQGTSLRSIFKEMDRGRKRYLDRNDLARLARWLDPQATAADVKWFQSMVDVEGDGAVYEEDLQAAIRGGRSSHRAVREGDSTLQALMRRVAGYLADNRARSRQLFEQLDADRSGYLEPMELLRFFREFLPELEPRDHRFLLAHMRSLDLNGDGRVSYEEFKGALRQAKVSLRAHPPAHDPVRYGGGAYGGSAYDYGGGGVDPAGGSGDDWDLEEQVHGGVPYLLDRRTGRLYEEGGAVGGGGYPRLVGYLDSDRGLVRRGEPQEFFGALEELLRIHGMRLKQLFREADVNGDRALDRREMRRLVHAVMPTATDADLRYLQDVVDLDGDGRITYDELRVCIQEGRLAGATARGRGRGHELDALLDRVGRYLREHRHKARDLFRQFDTDRSGYLERREAVRMTARLVPGLTAREQQMLLAHLRAGDLDGDGRLSFTELRQALRAAVPRVRRGGGDAYGRGPPPLPGRPRDGGYSASRGVPGPSVLGGDWDAPYGAPPRSQPGAHAPAWHLQDAGGGRLLDPDTQAVYELPPGAAWPRLVGVRRGAETVPPPADHFAALAAKLEAEGGVDTLLGPLFAEAAGDKSGRLDRREVPLLLQKLVPQARAAALDHFGLMIASGGDGPVSCAELAADIAECASASAAARGAPESSELGAVLARARAALPHDPAAVFAAVDVERRGAVEGRDVGRAVAALCPGLGARERRVLLAHLASEDAGGSGRLSLPGLLRGLRLVQPVYPAGLAPAGAAPPPQGTAAPPAAASAPYPPATAADAYPGGARSPYLAGGPPPPPGSGLGFPGYPSPQAYLSSASPAAYQAHQGMGEPATLRERMAKVDSLRSLRELATRHPRLHRALLRLEQDSEGRVAWESLDEVRQAMASEDPAALLRHTGRPREPTLNLVEHQREDWGHSQRLRRLDEAMPPRAAWDGPRLGPYGPVSTYDVPASGYMRGPYGPHAQPHGALGYPQAREGLDGLAGVGGAGGAFGPGLGGMAGVVGSRRFRWPTPGDPRSPDVFRLLHSYLRHQPGRVADLFRQLDADGSGSLSRRELVPLLRRLVPSVTPKDVAYFATLMDADGDGRVSWGEFAEAARRGYGTAKRLRAARRPPPELLQVLHGTAWVLAADPARAEAAWKAEAASAAGGGGSAGVHELDLHGATRFLRRIMPQVQPPHAQLLAAAISLMDRDDNGRLAFVDLVEAVRAGVTAGMGGGGGGHGRRTWRRRTGPHVAFSDTESDRWDGYGDSDSDEWGGGGYGSDGYGYGYDTGLRGRRRGAAPPLPPLGMAHGAAASGTGLYPGMGMGAPPGNAVGSYGGLGVYGGAAGGYGMPRSYGGVATVVGGGGPWHALPGGQMTMDQPFGPHLPGPAEMQAASLADAALKGLDGVYGTPGMGWWDAGAQDAPLLDNYYRWTVLQRERLVERWEGVQRTRLEAEKKKKEAAAALAKKNRELEQAKLEAEIEAAKTKPLETKVAGLEAISKGEKMPPRPVSQVQEEVQLRLKDTLDRATKLVAHYQKPQIDLYNRLLMHGYDLAQLPPLAAITQHQGHQIFWPPINFQHHGTGPVPPFPNPFDAAAKPEPNPSPPSPPPPAPPASAGYGRAFGAVSPPPPSAPEPEAPGSSPGGSRAAPGPAGYGTGVGPVGGMGGMDNAFGGDATGMGGGALHEVNEVIAMGGPYNGLTPSGGLATSYHEVAPPGYGGVGYPY